MKKFLIFVFPFFVGLIIGFFYFPCFVGNVVADSAASIGAVIDVSNTQATFTINSGVSGRIYNDGSEIVYINWIAGTVEKNTDAGDNKGYIPALSGGIISFIDIPAKVKKFSYATNENTSKLRYVSF